MRRRSAKSTLLAAASRSRTATDEAAEAGGGTPVEPARALADSVVPTAHHFFPADSKAESEREEHPGTAAATDAAQCSASQWRGAADSAGLADVAQSPAASARSAALTRAAAAEAAAAAPAPAAELTAPAMDERAAKVSPLDTAAPVASEMGAVADGQPSNQLVLRIWEAAVRRCEAHGPALSRAFGNFDRVVASGWLMGDALGLPHLERALALAAGLAAVAAAASPAAAGRLAAAAADRSVRSLGPLAGCGSSTTCTARAAGDFAARARLAAAALAPSTAPCSVSPTAVETRV